MLCFGHSDGCVKLDKCMAAARCLDARRVSAPDHIRRALEPGPGPEQVPRFDPTTVETFERVIITDDGKNIKLSVYEITLSPERALRLGAELIQMGLKAMERKK